MSAKYEPGQMIDFSAPPAETDLDQSRDALQSYIESTSDIHLILKAVNSYLISVGITKEPEDIMHGLREFTAPNRNTQEMIDLAYSQLFAPSDSTPRDKLLEILNITHVLSKPRHFPVQVYSHIPDEITKLGENGTHFGYVLNDGRVNRAVTYEGREYPLYPNTMFSFPSMVEITGNARMRIFTAIGQQALLNISGDIGNWGKQNYIDGCTSTLIIPPVMKGDACMNALYFPENVQQTRHTHPSIRAGIIAGGEGICRTPVGDIPLQPGNSFFLPPETWHSFHTEKGQTLSVVAFHPDSDFGPTHEDHPMLNRTHFQFLHMLKSAKKLSDQQ